ncbi:hypothetical protein ATY81_21760 [Rhizobium sp. R72]|nr:hypothetical protein ATY79_23900 [Rhizobium sp. R693]OWW02688.1 hypothetical protein ATY81_21760 [Rhizobium sp. R72]OWW02838.1 hypothetical protein ATY80_21760 [Rhizobium sp. R711]
MRRCCRPFRLVTGARTRSALRWPGLGTGDRCYERRQSPSGLVRQLVDSIVNIAGALGGLLAVYERVTAKAAIKSVG